LNFANVPQRSRQRMAVETICLRVHAGELYGLSGTRRGGKKHQHAMMLGKVWPTRR